MQYARVVAFTVSELFKENQQGSKITPIPQRLELKLQLQLEMMNLICLIVLIPFLIFKISLNLSSKIRNLG